MNVWRAQEAGLPAPAKPARDPHALLAAVRAERGAAPTESGEVGCGHAHDLSGVALGEKARALAHAQACALVATYGHALNPDLATASSPAANSSTDSTTAAAAGSGETAGGISEANNHPNGGSTSTTTTAAAAESQISQNKKAATAEASAADLAATATSAQPPTMKPASATQRLFKPMEEGSEGASIAASSSSSSSSSSTASASKTSFVFKALFSVLLSLILVAAYVVYSQNGSANATAAYGFCVENLPNDLALMLKNKGWLPEGAAAAAKP